MEVPTSPGGDALEGRSLLRAPVPGYVPGEEGQAGSHFSPAAMGLGELEGTETPKAAQRGLATAAAGSEAFCMAGKVSQSPCQSSWDEGICNVLLHLPSTGKESGWEAGGQVLRMGSGPRDGDVCKCFLMSCFFP